MPAIETRAPRHRILAPALVVAVLALLSFNGPAGGSIDGPAPKPQVKVVESTQVYWPGVIRKNEVFHRPAVLKTWTIFDAIPEWQKIKRQKLTDKDAEYHLLLAGANKRFQRSVGRVRKEGTYDIVAEEGALHCKNVAAIDITDRVVLDIVGP